MYGKILMYLIIHPCFYICFINVKKLAEDDKHISKHVGVLMDCVEKQNIDISAFDGFYYMKRELRSWSAIDRCNKST